MRKPSDILRDQPQVDFLLFQTVMGFLLSRCFLCRHAGVVEMSVRSLCGKRGGSSSGYAVYLTHDLNMLRLIEIFSESAPQVVLMLTILLQRGDLSPIKGAARSRS